MTSWSEIVNDGRPGTGLDGVRAMSRTPAEPDPGAEAAVEERVSSLAAAYDLRFPPDEVLDEPDEDDTGEATED